MRPIQVGSSRHSSGSDEGSLDQYLREISRYPLITQGEEVELAQRIHGGDEEALNKLVRSNLRFVVSVAKKAFIASPSNARAVCKHPRNLTDDQIKALAERGGTIGINDGPG